MRTILAALALIMGCIAVGTAPAQASPLADCQVANVRLDFDNFGSTGGFHAYCQQSRWVAATTAFYDVYGNRLTGNGGSHRVPADGQWHWIHADTSWGGVWQPVHGGCIWINLDNPSGPVLYSVCKSK
ncbi:hypothetical protein [Amycolatopsis sp. NPDC059021]|uniref:hypothetical protein n=1 Tax=Amycolatopsis sp. NPDC059021 TaxID=3346704 RepID=UPI003672DB9F